MPEAQRPGQKHAKNGIKNFEVRSQVADELARMLLTLRICLGGTIRRCAISGALELVKAYLEMLKLGTGG